jgi:hypothetical protein
VRWTLVGQIIIHVIRTLENIGIPQSDGATCNRISPVVSCIRSLGRRSGRFAPDARTVMVTEQMRTGLPVRHQARLRMSSAITGAAESVSPHLITFKIIASSTERCFITCGMDTIGSPTLQHTFLIPPGAALCQDELTEHGNVRHLILCHSGIFGGSRHGVQAQR